MQVKIQENLMQPLNMGTEKKKKTPNIAINNVIAGILISNELKHFSSVQIMFKHIVCTNQPISIK